MANIPFTTLLEFVMNFIDESKRDREKLEKFGKRVETMEEDLETFYREMAAI
ncbi:MAG: hypothetical protein AAF224_00380 [Pseudomonadota bacterium]